MGDSLKKQLSQGGILWSLKIENHSLSSGELEVYQTEEWQRSGGINMQEGMRNASTPKEV